MQSEGKNIKLQLELQNQKIPPRMQAKSELERGGFQFLFCAEEVQAESGM